MKRILFIMALSFVCMMLNAQMPFTFKTSETLLIERSVSDGIVLIRQDYQLEDTVSHKRYSLDNRSYFGRSYSLGVFTDKGIVTGRNVVKPWEYDSNFEQYKNGKYRPVLSNTMARNPGDSVWREIGSFATDNIVELTDTSWISVSDTTLNKGFSIDTVSGHNDGWLIWLESTKEHADTADLSLSINRYQLTISEDGTCTDDIRPFGNDSDRFGGLYIKPSFEHIGCIVLKLSGIIVNDNKSDQESWKFVKCPSLELTSDVPSETEVSTPVLTPVEDENKPDKKRKGRQNKKQENDEEN